MKFEITINSTEEAEELAINLASQLNKGDILCLKGDLGAGKTYLAGKIIQEILHIDTPITSPTFQILQTYEHMHHYDLYRLKSPEEIYEIGLEDSLDGSKIVIIEWPEIIRHLLPKDIIEIEILIDGNSRTYIIDDHTGKVQL